MDWPLREIGEGRQRGYRVVERVSLSEVADFTANDKLSPYSQ